MAFRFAALPALVAGLMGIGAAQAQAQTFPTRQVTFVVPVSPGGPVDLLARTMSAQFAERWKQPVIVENRTGGGLVVAARYVARSAPDGYTMLVQGGGVVTLKLFVKDPGVEPSEFAQVGQIGWGAYVLSVNPQVPAKTLAEFIKYAKANPDKLTYGSLASTVFDLDYTNFEQAAGVRMRNIPYQGAAPALQSVLKNETQLLLAVTGTAAPFFADGRLIPLAVAAPSRLGAFPNIPTAIEQGINFTAGFEHGLHVPAATPKDVLQKQRADLAAEVKNPAVQKKIRDLGLEPATITAEEFAQSLDRQAKLYTEAAKKIGLQPQ